MSGKKARFLAGDEVGTRPNSKLGWEAGWCVSQLLPTIVFCDRSILTGDFKILSRRAEVCFPGSPGVPRTQGGLENKHIPSQNRRSTIHLCS
jgi:hypothetical protein